MDPLYIKLLKSAEVSFAIRKDTVPYFTIPWHYHPELELTLILKGQGTRFVGECIELYQSGDLVLVGENIPHFWQSNKSDHEKDGNTEAIILHFLRNFWGVDFINLPEMREIRELIEKAAQGIHISGKTKVEVQKRLQDLLHLEGPERLFELQAILLIIAKGTDDGRLLSDKRIESVYKTGGEERLKKVYEYVMNNFREQITLKEIADIAIMSPTAFCRYFKSHTRNHFSRFLNGVRISYACKLLQEKKLTVTEIAFESGFNNLTNFNIQFKAFTKFSPLKYRQKHTSI